MAGDSATRVFALDVAVIHVGLNKNRRKTWMPGIKLHKAGRDGHDLLAET
jgi:hypothetical protein